MVDQRIRLITKIAEGGQNTVYLAKDLVTSRRVVIKMSKPSERGKLQRLLVKEADLGLSLNELDCVVHTFGLRNKLVKW